MKRVVITGIGAITPLGNDIETTWNCLLSRKSGIGTITRFDPSELPCRIAGEIKGFQPENYLDRKDILRLDPFAQYAAAAAIMAFKDSDLANSKINNLKTGVIMGSSRGGISTIEKALEMHIRKGKPFSAYLMSSSTINMASSVISIKLGTKGPALGISTACASGTNAIGEAFRMIQRCDIDIAFAGGAEAPICRLAVGGYSSSGALSKRNLEPQKASRPFDRDRDGFVISEGAGVVVLEEMTHALKRNARIYAELLGYGTSSDACHQTKPDAEGEGTAISMALKDANAGIKEVDYINAHATSTPLGDAAETTAVRKIFGDTADNIYISSCKSMLGHMLGAAGPVETAVTALSLFKGTVTPTINLDNPSPDPKLNYVTSAEKRDIRIAITNSFGFGGVNAVLVLKRV